MGRPRDWGEVFGFEDPTPGEVYEIGWLARRWSDVADEAEYAEARLRGLLGDGAVTTWIGKAGEAFRSHASDLPDQLGKTQRSYRQACEALSWWARRLELHQADADAALVRGRAAKADLDSALHQVSVAVGQVGEASSASALHQSAGAGSVTAPTREQVSAAMSRLASARASAAHVQALADDAQARLEAARRLAAEAGELRVADGREAAARIHEAAEAGIAPRSFWSKAGQVLASAWHVVVAVAKVVVAVLGVVALIIGGPIAWVVFAAALLVLADTLMKYSKGEASLLDVGLALLSCIPGVKGLTTLGELAAAFKAGGMLAAGAHLLGALRTAGIGIVRMAQRFRHGAVPAVTSIVGELGAITAEARSKTGLEVVKVFLGGVDDTRRAAVKEAWAGHLAEIGATDPARAARLWQGHGSYPGVDDWANDILPAGSLLEAGWPGTSGYAVPGGTAAAVQDDAAAFAAGTQVAPSVQHMPSIRSDVMTFRVNEDVSVATSVTAANPQYGSGGLTQHYIPDFNAHIANGSISAVDRAGSVLPVDVWPDGSFSLGLPHGPTIHLDNPFPAPGIRSPEEVSAGALGPLDVVPAGLTPWRFEQVVQGDGVSTR